MKKKISKKWFIIISLIGFIILLIPFMSIGKWWQGNQPRGYWRFNQGIGDALDSSWNNYTLENIGFVNYTQGKLGNGTTDFNETGTIYLRNVSFPNSGFSNFTLALWINKTLPSTSLTGSYVSNDDGWINLGQFVIGENEANCNQGEVWVRFKDTDGGYTDLCSLTNISNRDWHRIVLVKNSTNHGWAINTTIKLVIVENFKTFNFLISFLFNPYILFIFF